MRRVGLALGVAGLAAGADQATKVAVRGWPEGAAGDRGWVRHVENREPNGGIERAGPIVMAALSAGLLFTPGRPTPRAIGAGLVAGGTLSNSVELQVRDMVTDMIPVGRHATFNVADVTPFVGIGIVATSALRVMRRR